MKTFNVNTKSWHYWFYERSPNGNSWEDLNICTYLRNVGIGMLLIALVMVIAIFVLALAIEPWAVAIMTYITGQFYPGFFWEGPDMFTLSIIFYFCGIVVTLWHLVIVPRWERFRYRVRSDKPTPPPEPATGFSKLVKETYRAFKDKTCVKLERHTPEEK